MNVSATVNLPLRAELQNLIRDVGDRPEREGLRDTPARFERAFRELTEGYALEPDKVVGGALFAAENSGLVSVREIDFFSLCEHHLLPFFGQISITYQPREKILGLSKVARIVELYARRLQVQERLTREIAEAIAGVTGARSVLVTCEAQHLCMMMRGVRKANSTTRTEFETRLT